MTIRPCSPSTSGRTKLARTPDRGAARGAGSPERQTMADILGLIKQAAELKTKMEAMQAELDRIEVEGMAGGGLVTVRLTAKGEMKGLVIDATLMKPDEKEIVEDLVVAAHADARRKADVLLQEKMKALTGGLPLPPGLGFYAGPPARGART